MISKRVQGPAKITAVVSLLAACVGCSNPAFKSITGTLLSRTGYVNSTDVENALDAGGKLVKAQTSLTVEQEYYLGRAVSAKLLGRFTPANSAELSRYVNRVGGAVAGVSDVPETFGGYHFIVVNSPQINAMSAPGGFVFISSGFLHLLPDEDCLAAVLAHEVGHVVKRHGVNAISNASLFSALADFTKMGASAASSRVSSPVDLSPITSVFSDSVSGVVDTLLTKGFDRSQEYEADLYAAGLLQRAGYDPAAMIRVFQILEKHTAGSSEGWYATHPEPSDRIEELEDESPAVKSPQPPSSVRAARFASVIK